jgi:hypothetical protein
VALTVALITILKTAELPNRRLGKTQELPVFTRSISLTICNSSLIYILDRARINIIILSREQKQFRLENSLYKCVNMAYSEFLFLLSSVSTIEPTSEMLAIL